MDARQAAALNRQVPWAGGTRCQHQAVSAVHQLLRRHVDAHVCTCSARAGTRDGRHKQVKTIREWAHDCFQL